MSLASSPSNPNDLATAVHFRRAIGLLAPAALLFAMGCLVAAVVFSDAPMAGTGVVLVAAAAIFALAWRLLQCDRGQGYFIGRPASLPQIAELLLAERLNHRLVPLPMRPQRTVVDEAVIAS